VSVQRSTSSVQGTHILVAVYTAHREPEVVERGAVDIPVPGVPDQVVAQALELSRVGEIVGGVRQCRDFPLGRPAQDLQRPGPLDDPLVILDRQPFNDP